MRILLVRPPFVCIKNGPPLGLAYLSKAIKDKGYEVKVIDINIDINRKYSNVGDYTRDFILPDTHPAVTEAYHCLDDYCQDILSFSPDIVGFSLSYPTIDFGIAMAKKIAKHVRCIAGGPSVTYIKEKFLEIGCFDTIIIGYGEEAILESIDKKGIISKKLQKSKEYMPDFSDIPIEHYNGRLPVITSRGCPNSCNFCTQRFPYFSHSIDSVVSQIESTQNVLEVMYNDSNINVNTNRTECLFTELAKLKDPPRGHIFGLEVKKDFKRYVSNMAASGVREVRIGIESGALRERISMNKPYFSNEMVIELVKELTDHRILTLNQFIFCYPDQKENDRRQTVKLMHKINELCDANYVKHFWYKFVVHQGTEDFFLKKYGVVTLSPQNWKNSLYNPKKIIKIKEKYDRKIPGNAKILL